jgi:glutamate racemase
MTTEKRHHSIGMFDSGIGGLTVMQKVREVLPQESIVYFGDTARIPYGGKSRETLIRYSIESAIFLFEQDIKVLVIACNTAASAAMSKLCSVFNIPIIGVIEPGAAKAVSVTRNQRIAVLGTKATIQSDAYRKEIVRLQPQATVFSIACPLFVPFVEEGMVDHPCTKAIVKEYLAPLKNQGVDTAVLGCTHYPLLQHLIQEELGEEVTLVDSASTCAERVSDTLRSQSLTALEHLPAQYRYFVSDDSEKFRLSAEKIFGHAIPHVQLATVWT